MNVAKTGFIRRYRLKINYLTGINTVKSRKITYEGK